MRLEYSRRPGRLNFGDDLNKWLWPRRLKEFLDPDDGVAFVGIGTLLSEETAKKHFADAKTIVIFSSGAGEKSVPTIDDRWKIYCVRGPLTARRLGLTGSVTLGDGAYLLRNENLLPVEKIHSTGFIPHHASELFADWEEICRNAGLHYISPAQPVESFLKNLASCKKVVAEAMHGAITADALRIPWIPVRFGPRFCEPKWLDFFGSIHLSVTIQRLPFVFQKKAPIAKNLANIFKYAAFKTGLGREKWGKIPVKLRPASKKEIDELTNSLIKISKADGFLSDDPTVDSITQRLEDRLEQLKKDYNSRKLFS